MERRRRDADDAPPRGPGDAANAPPRRRDARRVSNDTAELDGRGRRVSSRSRALTTSTRLDAPRRSRRFMRVGRIDDRLRLRATHREEPRGHRGGDNATSLEGSLERLSPRDAEVREGLGLRSTPTRRARRAAARRRDTGTPGARCRRPGRAWSGRRSPSRGVVARARRPDVPPVQPRRLRRALPRAPRGPRSARRMARRRWRVPHRRPTGTASASTASSPGTARASSRPSTTCR